MPTTKESGDISWATNTPPWLTIVDANVTKAWFPVTETDADGNETESLRKCKVLTTITFQDGAVWKYSWTHKSWTQVEPGPPETDMFQKPVLDHLGQQKRKPAKVIRHGKDAAMRKSLAHCPKLITMLDIGLKMAEVM